MSKMKCMYCNSEIDSKSTSCPVCGKKITRFTLQEPNRRATFGTVIPMLDFSDTSGLWDGTVEEVDVRIRQKFNW